MLLGDDEGLALAALAHGCGAFLVGLAGCCRVLLARSDYARAREAALFAVRGWASARVEDCEVASGATRLSRWAFERGVGRPDVLTVSSILAPGDSSSDVVMP